MDESKRLDVIEKRGVDILYAALIFEGIVLTKTDNRQDYGEERLISLGMVDDEPFVVVHTIRNGITRLITAWKGGGLSMSNIKQASLEEIRRMKDNGELKPDTAAEAEELGENFWADAVAVEPESARSVRLNLDPEVFEFFKAQGKGHITRMQNVLKMYVNAHRGGR